MVCTDHGLLYSGDILLLTENISSESCHVRHEGKRGAGRPDFAVVVVVQWW